MKKARRIPRTRLLASAFTASTLALCVTVALQAQREIPLSAQSSMNFTDLLPSDPAYIDMRYLWTWGYIQGYSDGTVRPDNPIARAEFAKLIVAPTTTYEQREGCLTQLPNGWLAPDVTYAPGVWYGGFSCIEKANGEMVGDPSGTLRPGDPINWAETAKIVTMRFQIPVRTLQTGEPWFMPPIEVLRTMGVVPDTIVSPSHKLTRREFAQLLRPLIQKLDLEPGHGAAGYQPSGMMPGAGLFPTEQPGRPTQGYQGSNGSVQSQGNSGTQQSQGNGGGQQSSAVVSSALSSRTSSAAAQQQSSQAQASSAAQQSSQAQQSSAAQSSVPSVVQKCYVDQYQFRISDDGDFATIWQNDSGPPNGVPAILRVSTGDFRWIDATLLQGEEQWAGPWNYGLVGASADGKTMVFENDYYQSSQTNRLISYDWTSDTYTLLPMSDAAKSAVANGQDARFVAYYENGTSDFNVYDRLTGSNTVVEPDYWGGCWPSFSANAAYLAYMNQSYYASTPTPQFYTVATGAKTDLETLSCYRSTVISNNGRYIASPGGIYDRATGTTYAPSVNGEQIGIVDTSADARYAVATTSAPGQTTVYVYDRVTNTTKVVGTFSYFPAVAISRNGSVIAVFNNITSTLKLFTANGTEYFSKQFDCVRS